MKLSFRKFILIISSVLSIHIVGSAILNPVDLRGYMFQGQITGDVNVLTPVKKNVKVNGKLFAQSYEIDMVKTQQQILPKGLYGKTTIYAYAGKTNNGYKAMFPGPAIVATKDRPIRVKYRNSIPGPHILPVDFTNPPFLSSGQFVYEVPTVPHAHGIAVQEASDGQPEAWWTRSGNRSPFFKTQEPCKPNEAVFHYPNEQDAGNDWYHDHAFGITRLNVYAGLAGLFKIVDPNSTDEKRLVQKFGDTVKQSLTKYLIISDKTFKTTGQLFYPNSTQNPRFQSWVPEFFGNTMLVNGVIWPKMKVKQQLYRFVLLNACNSRFLNIWFENNGNKLPFRLIRVDNDFYENQVTVQQLLANPATRFEFLLDFTGVGGQVILKNNAPAPFPNGTIDNFSPQFNGNIMKFIITKEASSTKKSTSWAKRKLFEETGEVKNIKLSSSESKRFSKDSNNKKPYKQPYYPSTPFQYPAFPPGQKVITTLFEAMNMTDGFMDAMLIDGVPMEFNGSGCTNATYQIGGVYDFYLVNLTPDTHPIHFHLVNMQKIRQYKFDAERYLTDYLQTNLGGADLHGHGFHVNPIQLDPDNYRDGNVDEFPTPAQQVFRDTINADPGYVTVVRIKFAKNDGQLWKSFSPRGMRYVFHCHILEHEDNMMMKYFCMQ